MLRKTQNLAEKADYSALKTHILPRAQRLSLATTSAGVRGAAFEALTALAPRFDKEVAVGLVGTLQQVWRQHEGHLEEHFVQFCRPWCVEFRTTEKHDIAP